MIGFLNSMTSSAKEGIGEAASVAGGAVSAGANVAAGALGGAVKNAVQNPMQTLTNMANAYTPPSKGDKGQEAGSAGKTTDTKKDTAEKAKSFNKG